MTEPQETLRLAVAEIGGIADRTEAVAAIQRAGAAAGHDAADLLCLPLLSTAPFFPRALPRSRDWYDIGERGSSASVEAFRAVALESRIWVTGSYYEIVSEGVFYARSVLIDPGGGVRSSYRQMHVDRRPGTWELFYLQPGRGDVAVVPTPFGAVGLLSGADAQYPEAWRLVALAGGELVLLGLSEPRDQVQPLLREVAGAAAANALLVVAANRSGRELGTDFPGASQCLWVDGAQVAPQAAGEIRTWELDLAAARSARREHRALRGRRPERYGPILEI
jgi:N-carbamoylputrescine amidase